MMVNIYLSDDLAASVKAELGEANISGIAQNALRAELARARGLPVLADEYGFQRVEVVAGHLTLFCRELYDAERIADCSAL
jgi:hypothetical protein